MASTPIKNENGNDDTMNGNGDANNVSDTKRKDVVNDSTNNRRTLSAIEENGEYPNNTQSDTKSQLILLIDVTKGHRFWYFCTLFLYITSSTIEKCFVFLSTVM